MSIKDDDHYRIYRIKPPHLDPDTDYPATDCQHDDLRDLFFGRDIAEPGGRETAPVRLDREEEARRVCATCPFVVACGLHGLEYEDYGVWGGMSEQDRRTLGGRGISGASGKSSVRQVLRRMGKAGIPAARVTELLARWREEQAA